MLDTVTIVFEPELPMLRAQARSISLYAHDIGTITVVVNDRPHVGDLIDPAWWGQYASHVNIVHHNQWFKSVDLTGWVSQQILKLLAAGQNPNEWSWVLDAKTILIRDFVPGEYTNQQGKIITKHQALLPVFAESKQIVDQLFDIDLTHVAGPGGVPHWVNNQACRDIMKFVLHKTSLSLIDFWQQNGRLTEFMLHSGWLQRQGGLDSWYADQQEFACVNIAHNEGGIFESKLQELKQFNTLTFSVHRDAVLQPAQWQTLNDFFQRRGISWPDRK